MAIDGLEVHGQVISILENGRYRPTTARTRWTGQHMPYASKVKAD